MLRHALALALFAAAASPCWAETDAIEVQSMQERGIEFPRGQDDPGFVRASDLCGASRYQHMVDENARATPVSFPPDTRFEWAPRTLARSLEYTPHRLNVVVDDAGRIVAIGCY